VNQRTPGDTTRNYRWAYGARALNAKLSRNGSDTRSKGGLAALSFYEDSA
jgi:hypothetical protein